MAQQMTWDLVTKGSNASVDSSNGYIVTSTGSTNNGIKTDIGFSTGKYYMEFTIVKKGECAIGICNENETLTSNSLGSSNQIIFYYNGNVFPSNVGCGLSGLSNGSVLQIKIDADNKTMVFGLNGTWSSNTFTLTGNEFFPVVRNFSSSDSTTVQANFGQKDFAYDVPEGFIGANSGGGTVTGSLLLKANDKFYSIKESIYDTSTQQYTELTISDLATDIETYGFNNIEDLITEVTIGAETFKPIDKFDSFQIISIKEKANVTIQGRKSDTELVVGSSSFNSNIASNIDYFKATANTDNNAYIKMAISIDEGLTWKTTSDSGVTWTDLSCTIPLKEYADLTSDEKIQWNTARDEINNNGFNVTDIETIDFNTLKADTIIFAYVLYQDTYNSICDNLSLEWQFDSKGTMVKMGTDECKIALTEDKVIVTPTSNQSMMKINILNGLVDMGGGGSANFESATSTDIQNILSKGW